MSIMNTYTKPQSLTAPTRRKQWQRLLSWLFLVATIALLVWPVTQLWPLAGYIWMRQELATASNDYNWVELDESSHFRLVGPAGYMSEGQVKAFLVEAEARRTQLVAFLEIPPKIILRSPYGYTHKRGCLIVTGLP